MYSIKNPESDSARLIAAVVVEEMLHVCLTTNLLLAVGGEPDFSKSAIPIYPGRVAHRRPALALELRGCSLGHIRDTFMEIERPQNLDADPEDDDFETLGQFYAALERAIDELSERKDLFADHQPLRQLSNPAFYGPVAFDAKDSGGLMLITDRTSARAALDVVVHQGEGIGHERWADPDHLELTHYYKFEQLASGAVEIGDVWPVLDNPHTADLPEAIQDVSHLFNGLYRLTIGTMEGLFSGRAAQGAGIGTLYSLMTGCLAPTARYLVTLPAGDGRTAGPTFEYYEFEGDPRQQVAQLASTVAAQHDSLTEVAARVGALAET
jgi:hypothetical protein